MATTLDSPFRLWGTFRDTGTYGKRISSAVNNLSIFMKFYWIGASGFKGSAATLTPQLLMYNGDPTVDGYGIYISGPGLPFSVSSSLGIRVGARYIAFGIAGIQPLDGSWNYLLISRIAGVWTCVLNGSARGIDRTTPDGLLTLDPDPASNQAFIGGNGDVGGNGNIWGSEGLAPLNGVIDTFGFWVGSGSAPLTNTDATNLMAGIDPSLVSTTNLVVSYKMTGQNSSQELDTSGNNNTLAITNTTCVRSGSTDVFLYDDLEIAVDVQDTIASDISTETLSVDVED